MNHEYRWLDGPAIWRPAISARALGADNFAGMDIIVNDQMPVGQVVVSPSGSIAMCASTLEEIRRQIADHIGVVQEAALLKGLDAKTVSTEPDQETVAMQSCELWGAF